MGALKTLITDEEQATAAVAFGVTVNPYDRHSFKPVHGFQLKSYGRFFNTYFRK